MKFNCTYDIAGTGMVFTDMVDLPIDYSMQDVRVSLNKALHENGIEINGKPAIVGGVSLVVPVDKYR